MKKTVLIGIVGIVAVVAIVAVVVITAGFASPNNCRHNDPLQIIVIEAEIPTCQENGLTEGKKCNLCGTMVVPQSVVDTIDCIEGSWIVDKEATKTKDGKRHTECTMCGKTFKEQILGAGSQGLNYLRNNDGTYTVCDIGTCTDSEIIVPSVYNGEPVTRVGEYAFNNCTLLTSVVMPNSIVSVEFSAFAFCRSLTEITIPDSVTSIGDSAFTACELLNDVYYVGDVSNWLKFSFGSPTSTPMYYATNLYFNGELVTEVIIPDGVTKIGAYAFYNCKSLTKITIPKSVETIEHSAFSRCNSVESVYFGGTFLQWYAFRQNNCVNFNNTYTVYFDDGTIYGF